MAAEKSRQDLNIKKIASANILKKKKSKKIQVKIAEEMKDVISDSVTASNIFKKQKKSKKLKVKMPEKVKDVISDNKNNVAFHEMGIDDRILEGIAALRWPSPTLVQEQAIPFMLAGKSVVAQARTGSGKTGAFLVPCLHRVLSTKTAEQQQCLRVLVLAPSKELCRQISEMASQLAVFCSREIRVLDLSPQMPLEHQRSLLAELPDIVVGPPGRVLSHVQAGNMSLTMVQTVVVDEADLMVAYQHGSALQQIWSYLPEFYQVFVTSATLTKDMKRISELLLSGNETQLLNTVVLRLKDPPLPAHTQLTQYVIKLEEFEKAVLLYALYRLKMIAGKTIIFVNSVNKGYKLRMFLGQFGVSSCILNCELPGASRCDIIEQFNAGRYETIIATDETCLQQGKETGLKDVETDIESGSSRGLDFQFVCNIINFDFPVSETSYIHRVGRTARGSSHGTALSMVSVQEHDTYTKVSKALTAMMAVGQDKGKTGDEGIFRKYIFDLSQLDGFSYRAADVWRMCTAHAVLQTRKREIAQQLLNSSKLAAFFQDNPSDRDLLRHDKSEHGMRTQPHLRHVPEYNIPEKLRGKGVAKTSDGGKDERRVKRLQGSTNTGTAKDNKKKKPFNKFSKKRNDNSKAVMTKTQRKHAIKKSDPLRSMTFSGFSTS